MSAEEKSLSTRIAELEAENASLKLASREPSELTMALLKGYVATLRSPDRHLSSRDLDKRAYPLSIENTIGELFEFTGMLATSMARCRAFSLYREHLLALAARAIRLYEDGVHDGEEGAPF